ncbi:polyketide cyclase [Saccharomonospora sp. CUA-673]|uniref:SRPBCC domain-containing protein n=1 Tax=Saccharomonospora sp. CUA-673 TaxID=1904969 RepID=UPI00095A130E|nr:SRPBCC domain-containing protein [Saccharomonospora sp. CUA-673]OLT49199.1 polyketide cyclase [Saccharomonospora sp. CUA-673]
MNHNLDHDLTVHRIIRAPRETVWNAWTKPDQLAQWWIPAPIRCRVEQLDVQPGGAFVTRMSEDGGEFVPHIDGCFVAVDELERIVFTNAIDSSWRPALPQPVALTASITFADHPDGTDYRIVARHASPESRVLHEKLGFADGWGTVADQLASFVTGR